MTHDQYVAIEMASKQRAEAARLQRLIQCVARDLRALNNTFAPGDVLPAGVGRAASALSEAHEHMTRLVTALAVTL